MTIGRVTAMIRNRSFFAWSSLRALCCAFVCLSLLPPSPGLADPSTSTVKEKDLVTPKDGVTASPKPGWGDFEVVEKDLSKPWWQQVLLWPVNRVLDVIDVVKFDVGVGTSFGGVARVTKYGQVGYRSVSPASLRVGNFGRRAPVMVESSNEFGAGPAFIASKDRDICKAEFGLGLDLFVGGYVGICGDEVIDLVSGIFFLDTSDDDIR